jgi:uncharacterized protein
MTLQKRLKTDLTAAIKAKDEDRKSALRVILGEFARLYHKELSDDEVIGVLRKLVKAEKELQAQQGKSGDTAFMQIVSAYLPQMASPGEIEAWITENVDFESFRNKMQAMRVIMKHFGARADGNVVKGLLQKM